MYSKKTVRRWLHQSYYKEVTDSIAATGDALTARHLKLLKLAEERRATTPLKRILRERQANN